MSVRRLLVSCSNRSEYGLIRPLLLELAAAHARYGISCTLLLHSDAVRGCREDAERDLAGEVEIEVVADSARRAGESVSDHFARLVARFDGDILRGFDAALIPGDRYETVALVTRCFFEQLPVLHVFGGDVSCGGHYDDHLRHAVSQLASLHFPVNRSADRNLRAMLQESTRIFHLGSPVVDEIAQVMMAPSNEYPWDIIISFNPMTLGPREAVSETLRSTLDAIESLDEPPRCLATRPNREPGSDEINALLDSYADRPWFEVITSLGSPAYLHAIRRARLVVGNSSSQLLEVPVVGTHSLLLGDRQKGRHKPDTVTVLAGQPDAATIRETIVTLLRAPRPTPCADYGLPGVSAAIVSVIARAIALPRAVLVSKNEPLHLAPAT